MIPRSERSLGEGSGYPLQYFCLENPILQRSMAGYSPQGPKESDRTEQHFTLVFYGGLPGGSGGKESTYNATSGKESAYNAGVQSLGGEDPLE